MTEIKQDDINGAIKSLRWVANQIPNDLGNSREEKMLRAIQVYCANGAIVLEKVGEIVDKETPMAVTHEATFKELRTCPRCKNVISRTETWGDSEIITQPLYCPYCGQHLKGDNE